MHEQGTRRPNPLSLPSPCPIVAKYHEWAGARPARTKGTWTPDCSVWARPMQGWWMGENCRVVFASNQITGGTA